MGVSTASLIERYTRCGDTLQEIASKDPMWTRDDWETMNALAATQKRIREMLEKRGVTIPKPMETC